MENVIPSKSSFNTFIDILKDFIQGVIDLIYPPLCLICENRLDEDAREICLECLSDFKLLGAVHENFSVPGTIYISKAWPLFDFDRSFQQLIHHLKYSRRRKPIAVVLDHYESQILRQLPENKIDLIISIPLHPLKLRERGYNQVEDMSRWLAQKLQATVGDHLVKRVKYTTSQTKLSAHDRAENVQNAFGLTDETALKDMHILLVDDVLTTGATANALAQLLAKSGAKRIDLITLSTPQFGNA